MNYDTNHSDQEFDSFLKEKYKNHRLNPDEELWEGINSRINQNKLQSNIKQVRRLKYISASLAASLIISFIYFEHRLRTHEKPEIAQESVNNISTENTFQSVDSLNVNLFIQKKEPVNANTSQKINGKEKNLINAKNSNSIKQIKSNDLTQINTLPPDTSKTTNTAIKNDDSYIASNISLTGNDAQIPEEKNSNSGVTSLNQENKKISVTKPENEEFSGTNNHIVEKRNSETEEIEQKLNNENSINIETKIPKEEPLVANIENEQNVSFNSILSDSVKSNDAETIQISDNLVNSDTQIVFTEPPRNLRKRKYFIEGFYSPELSYRFITQNPEYKQTRYNKAYFNARDKADFTFSAGLYGGLSLNESFSLMSGIYYSQYAQKFKTEAVNILHNSYQGYFLYTSTGVANLMLSSSDSIPAETFLNSSIRYNYLNLPLILDYKVFRYQHINFGFNFNYLLSQELNWQSENSDGNTEPHYDEVSGIKTAMVSLILGTTYEHPLTHNISFIINPTLKLHVMAFSKSSPVHAYPYSWGLRVGVRYLI